MFEESAAMGDYLSILAITLERLVFINWPFKYDSYMTKYHVSLILFLIIAISLGLSVLMIFGSDILTKEDDCLLFKIIEEQYVYGVWIPFFVIVTSIVTIFFIRIIYLTQYKQGPAVIVPIQIAGDNNRNSTNQANSQKKASKGNDKYAV